MNLTKSLSFFYSLFLIRKKKSKIAYLMSFPRNDTGLIIEMTKRFPDNECLIFYRDTCKLEVEYFTRRDIKSYSIEPSIIFFFKVLFELCQSKIIICDNYFAFLGGLHLDSECKVIQLWHANGAIKNFGWEDKQTKHRSKLDKRRFKKVYQRFDEYVVGSKRMGQSFQRCYGATPSQIKYLGYPRTDNFFDREQVLLKKKKIYEKYKCLEEKKIILYAPTYRMIQEKNPIDFNCLEQEFSEHYVLIIKTHPNTHQTFEKIKESTFYLQELSEFPIEVLLSIADVLITDYSSLVFDYSLLKVEGKIIFFWYDYLFQMEKIGIQSDFFEWNSEIIVYTIDELITAIKNPQKSDLKKINLGWNEYNDGMSTVRFFSHLKKLLF